MMGESEPLANAGSRSPLPPRTRTTAASAGTGLYRSESAARHRSILLIPRPLTECGWMGRIGTNDVGQSLGPANPSLPEARP